MAQLLKVEGALGLLQPFYQTIHKTHPGGAMSGRRFDTIIINNVVLRSPLETMRFAKWVHAMATHFPVGTKAEED